MEEATSLVEDIINEERIEPSKEELESFKNLVNDWFKYDDQIRKLQIAMKERKNYQRVLNSKIEQFMFNYKYNDLNTQHGRIKTNVKECKVPIKMNDIKTKIMQYNNLSGEELLKRIFEEDRETILKKNIRRIIPKVSLTI
jgi:hypothetical protein|tara:strand:- start:312 stop:734 length:423 start_codon:yes stop_codon:yes gene_type:complete